MPRTRRGFGGEDAFPRRHCGARPAAARRPADYDRDGEQTCRFVVPSVVRSRSAASFRGAPLACLAASAGAQLAVPAGFVDEIVYGTGFASPTALALVPDGRFFVLENNTANVKLVAGSAAATVYTVPNVSTNSDRGLQGIVLDPLWPTWPYAYLHYTHASGTVRVVRYTVSGALTSPTSTAVTFGSPYEIINDAPDAHFWHNGGTLRFGPDGFLYVSLGDDNAQCDAQNLESLRGAILRLDVGPLRGAAGSGPPAKSLIAAPGNPFVGTNGQLVYAYGLRNPFRFDIDSVTGRLYVADVGAGAHEELDEIVAGGANFGWPYFEGNAPFATCPAPTPAWTAPIYTHPNPGGAAIALFGGRYRNPPLASFGFGPSYEGDVFVVDVVQGFVRRLRETGRRLGAGPRRAGSTECDRLGERIRRHRRRRRRPGRRDLLPEDLSRRGSSAACARRATRCPS
jgi:glucose/arabinose dehydrogenase